MPYILDCAPWPAAKLSHGQASSIANSRLFRPNSCTQPLFVCTGGCPKHRGAQGIGRETGSGCLNVGVETKLVEPSFDSNTKLISARVSAAGRSSPVNRAGGARVSKQRRVSAKHNRGRDVAH